MPCERAFRVDLAAFLAEPASSELAEFRAHLGGCADCTSEVEVWRQLDRELRGHGASAPDEHPEPELLLRFGERRGTLSERQIDSIARHLAVCFSCQDELAALKSFDFDAVREEAAAAPRSWRETVPALLTPARGLVLHPAFAYGLVLLALLPTALRYVEPPARLAPAGPAAPAASEPLADAADEFTRLTARSERRERLVGRSATRQEGQRAEEEGAQAARLAPAEPEPPAAFRAGSERTEEADEVGMLRAAPSDRAAQVSAALSKAGRGLETVRSDDVVILRVPVPGARTAGGEIEVRVLSPDRRREIRQRFASAADVVQMRVPVSWLTPGAYRVEVHSEKASDVPLSSFQLDAE